MTGLHAALAALLAPGVAPDGEPLPEWVHVDELRRLLDEHPAALPVATDSTTAVEEAPCVHCGRALAAHGERGACTKAGYYGNRYTAPEPSDRAEYGPCNHECNGCPTCDPGLTSDRAGLSYADKAAWRRDAIADMEGDVYADLDRRRLLASLDEIERLQAKVSEAQAQVRDYKRGITWDTTCTSCAKAVEQMHAVEQEAATLRAQVAAAHEVVDRMTHDTYAEHCATRVEGTPAHGGGRCPKCDPLAALGDSAQVVQRIKDEAAADELEKAGQEALDVAFGSNEDVRDWLDERARRVRDGEPS